MCVVSFNINEFLRVCTGACALIIHEKSLRHKQLKICAQAFNTIVTKHTLLSFLYCNLIQNGGYKYNEYINLFLYVCPLKRCLGDFLPFCQNIWKVKTLTVYNIFQKASIVMLQLKLQPNARGTWEKTMGMR